MFRSALNSGVLIISILVSVTSPEDRSASMIDFNAILLKCQKVQKREIGVGSSYDSELIVNVRVNPSRNINKKRENYLLLDEVYDTRMHTKSKLMSPYLIEIIQEEPIISYPLKYSGKLEDKQHWLGSVPKVNQNRRKRDIQTKFCNYDEHNKPLYRNILKKQFRRRPFLKGNHLYTNEVYKKRYKPKPDVDIETDPMNNLLTNDYNGDYADEGKNKFNRYLASESHIKDVNKGYPFLRKPIVYSEKLHYGSKKNLGQSGFDTKKLNEELMKEVPLEKLQTPKFLDKPYLESLTKGSGFDLPKENGKSLDESDDFLPNQKAYLPTQDDLNTIDFNTVQDSYRETYRPGSGSMNFLSDKSPDIFERGEENSYDDILGAMNYKKGQRDSMLTSGYDSGAPYTCNMDIQACKSCGGKNKKKGGSGGATGNTESDTDIEEIYDAVQQCQQGVCKCHELPNQLTSEDNLSASDVCKCKTQPDECICDLWKNKRDEMDRSYSIFNLTAPTPYLSAKVRIFRRKNDGWSKVAPALIVHNDASTFVDENIALSFFPHLDILGMEKLLQLQNYQLFVPESNDEREKRTEFDLKEPDFNEMMDTVASNLDESLTQAILLVDPKSGFPNDDFLSCKEKPCSTEFLTEDEAITNNNRYNGVYRVEDLSVIPSTVKLVDRCLFDNSKFCLNLIPDQPPAYSMKLKMPFKQNIAIRPSNYKVKIFTIVTDATTKDALQVSVDLINEGVQSQQFVISVSDCPTPYLADAQTNVVKHLMPHIGETVTYLLPLAPEASSKHKTIVCQVVVMASSAPNVNVTNDKVVAMRAMHIEAEKRCLCVWHCNCHCIPKLETRVDYHVCQKMSEKDLRRAGLLFDSRHVNNTEFQEDTIDVNNDKPLILYNSRMLLYSALVLLTLLSLGFLKAFIGLCSESVNKCGYDCVLHKGAYMYASRCRRFWVNLVFFVVLPFSCCCRCFQSSKEDFAVESVEWVCQRSFGESSDYSASENLSDWMERCSGGESLEPKESKNKMNRPAYTSAERPLAARYVDRWNQKFESLARALNEEICNDPYTTEEDEASQIVFQTIAESNSVMTMLCRPVDQITEQM